MPPDLLAKALSPCAMIGCMRAQVSVIVEGEDVFVRCDLCGLVCGVPLDLTSASFLGFVDEHDASRPVSDHPAECPSWAVAAELPAS